MLLMPGGFFPQTSSLTPSGRHTVQFHSDTNLEQHPRLRAQTHETAPLQMPTVDAQLPTTFVWLGYKSVVPLTSSLGSTLSESSSQNPGKELTSYCWLIARDIFRIQKNSHMEGYGGWVLQGSWAKELLSLWNRGAPPSWHVDTFTKLEVLRIPYIWDFYGGFIMQEWLIIKLISRPSPFPWGWGWGWKHQASNQSLVFLVSSPHPEVTKNHLMITKIVPTTQEIPRDGGAQCQELGSKIKY